MKCPPGVDALIKEATEIRVMSPSLVGPLAWLTGDTRVGRSAANERLAEMLGRVDEEAPEVPVSGKRGDELAGTAMAEALVDFDADHVLMVVAPGDALWRRRRVLERLLDEYGLNVTIALA